MSDRRKHRTSFMQKVIRELIEEEDLDLSSDEAKDENVEAAQQTTSTKRGRRAIPEKWTRVISIYKDDLSKV